MDGTTTASQPAMSPASAASSWMSTCTISSVGSARRVLACWARRVLRR
jgi:hypothetical protein